jgi:RimJ/RimL family protein N-acetyltransferase
MSAAERSGPSGSSGAIRAESRLPRVRLSCRGDREALEMLGHPPPVAASLSPSLTTRLAWVLAGLRARALVAVDGSARVVGSVQFVRERSDSGTWMFGHWRVATPCRRRGIGRTLIVEGLRLIPAIRRLYSYVDRGNQVSVSAHLNIGFEMAPEIQGSAPLGALSTIGPTAPAIRFEPGRRGDLPLLTDLYRKAMGPLWFRLFPGDRHRFWPALGAGTEGPFLDLLRGLRAGPALLAIVSDAGPAVGFVAWRGGAATPTLFVDPAACDAALLARVAARLVALGARRDAEILLRGLPIGLLASAGPVAARLLMGLPDAASRLGR